MGEAKNRGTREQRVKEAKSKRPETLTCGECGTKFSDFETMDTRGMHGIDGIYAGFCPSCGATVFAVEGEEEARLKVAQEWQAVRTEDLT